MDWNFANKPPATEPNSRTLRGCVDWNKSWLLPWIAPIKSHPTWVRGLKLFGCTSSGQDLSRTLRGCVDWNCRCVLVIINTFCRTLRGCVDWNVQVTLRTCRSWVAPYVGAWIETIWLVRTQLWALSHPTWARGLKPITRKCWGGLSEVAPYVGAWIETSHIFGE